MAIYNTPDGRQVVGSTTAGNDYHGFNGKRDIIIQLTENGATTDGLNALEYLKAYATNANAENKPIFPNGARVWISANGYTKAVEADDVVIDGSNVTIGGIVWNGSAWDFSNAGQSGGGGSGGGVLVVTDTDGTLDKTWQEIHDNPVAVILNDRGMRIFVSRTSINGPTSYVVTATAGPDDAVAFVAQSASGYPTLSE